MRTLQRARPHLLGWLILALILAVQPWGLTAADTKHDLAANPLRFLAGALHAYTDTFTLGQLQNQAYGYLFPQGPFFVLTQFLPDWVAQRAWWLIVLGVGFSGFYILARRVVPGPRPEFVFLAALAFALSPRALTTLTAISSETWPVMLAPWVLVPLTTARVTWRHGLAAVLPVAAMGAVNATATLAACVPAGLYLLYRRQFAALGAWLAGCALVSVWWIGPLLILGRYAPPFTEYIESAFVTTRWLNLAEIIRGTTSWAPFVDTEREAGNLLVSEPVFILATMAVAAVGVAGLTRLPRVWVVMALAGVAILGTTATAYVEFLDGPGAALRNLHKFDPVLRIPLLLGVAAAGQRLALPRTWGQLAAPTRRMAAGALVSLCVLAAAAPAWSGRLLPTGAYEKVPDYWHAAADYVNETAAQTRTLIYPPASFARQEWGWTRDEPAQPLLEVPWAVRDAIPLVPPEAIRGLDGVMAALDFDPQAGAAALERLGIGTVIVRGDLDGKPEQVDVDEWPGTHRSFGPLTVITLDPQRSMALTADEPLRVAGGGEALAFLDMADGPAPRQLVQRDAQIVTDTPLLTDRNYGTLTGPVSAPMSDTEPTTVRNRLRDYASAGAPVSVSEYNGTVRASSSAADASAFGGADPARSITAAVDGFERTAWWPAPGQLGWIELRTTQPVREVVITATDDTTVKISGDDGTDTTVTAKLQKNEPTTVRIAGGASSVVRVNLTERVGIAEIASADPDTPLPSRVVSVPDTSPDVQQFLFQRLAVDTGMIIREFTAPREMTVRLDSHRLVTIDGQEYSPGDTLTLSQGTHRLDSRAQWLMLSDVSFNPTATYTTTGTDIAAADSDRLLVTGRAANEGLRGFLTEPGGEDVELEPTTVDAATQAFSIPAGARGEFRMEFAADGVYRATLFGGAALALLTVIVCAWLSRGRDNSPVPAAEPRTSWPVALFGLGALALVGWPAALAGVAAWAVLRFTTMTAPWLSGALVVAAGAMLARAGWAQGAYAGDSWLVTGLVAAALACAFLSSPKPRIRRIPGSSTKV